MPPIPKIARLPDEYRAWLRSALVDRAFGDIQGVTDELNEMLKAGGIAISVGKSAIGAESQKIRRAQESIRAATESAKLIAEASRDDGDMRSEAVMALIQSDMFEALLLARESETMEDPLARLAAMSEAAKAAARLTVARVNQSKWRNEIEARAKAAAEKVAKIAKAGGMKPAQVAEIRRQILGVAKQATSQAAQPGAQ
jgi:hypothetical protein